MSWNIHEVYGIMMLIHIDESYFELLKHDWYMFGAFLEALDSSVGDT
jgi:hypothetical protein